MSFGSGPFGAMAFGAGCSGSIVLVEQVTRNTVRVVFSGIVKATNRGNVADALYDRGWTLTAYNDATAQVPRVIYAVPDPDVPNAILLSLDSVLTPFVVYELTASGLVVTGPNTARFASFGELKPVPDQVARSFDLANRPSGELEPGKPAPLGTLDRANDGDFANDEGVANTRKRIIRRLTTRRGAFAHLPDYGLDLPLKRLFRPSTIRDVQSQAEAQIRAEPGVLNVTVTVQAPVPNVLRINSRVETASGTIGVSVSIPVPVV